MKVTVFKKIITLTYLIIFLLGLFVPFNQSFAQENFLIISTDKSDPQTGKVNLKIGETVKVIATNTTIIQIGGEIVSFSSLGNDTGLNPKTCAMPGPSYVQSCFVNYSSLIEGTFTLKASATLNGTLYESSISVTIKGCADPKQVLVNGICKDPVIITPINLNCTLPQVLNEAKDSCITPTNTTYTPLAPLPGLPAVPYETDTECPLGNYLNIIIKLVIGIAAVLAMVMIVMGGIEYMTSDLISSKESGKDTIRNAILGLLIALGAYLILNTINPQLLSVCLDKLPEAVITIYPYSNSAIVKTSGSCKEVSSGLCNVSNLSSKFGDKAINMSKICSIESGGKEDKISGYDKCGSDGTPFSFGLFQINIIANGGIVKTSDGNLCSGLFTLSNGSPISGNNYIKKDNSNGYDCKLKSDKKDLYEKCKVTLLNGTKNIEIAYKLYSSYGLKPWEASDYKVCSSAFQ